MARRLALLGLVLGACAANHTPGPASVAAAGLVRRRRRGRERIWQLEPRRLGEARGYLDRISAEWDAALDRLRRFVEEAG